MFCVLMSCEALYRQEHQYYKDLYICLSWVLLKNSETMKAFEDY